MVELLTVGAFSALIALAGVIGYYVLGPPTMRQLSESDLEICRRLVEEGDVYPFVCRQAVCTGLCPCCPCEKLRAAREKGA